jgi:SAM-dependent methyltransferase
MKVSASLVGAWLTGRRVFEMPYYRESVLARLMNLFAHVNLDDWQGMSVLEVGAGLGHIGDVFAGLGFDVTSTDGRSDHVEHMRARGRKAFVLDCDQATADVIGGFDVVVAFGVLYHLTYPERLIAACSRSRVLLLETAVCDSTEVICPKIREARGWRGQDQALNELGCRPSPAWVEDQAGLAGFDRMRDISNGVANWSIGVLDWEARNDGAWKRDGMNLRKMWVFERAQAAQSRPRR